MHPLIRVFGLFALVLSLTPGHWYPWFLGALVSAYFYARLGVYPGADLYRRLRRLKWLFLSILVLYGWAYPGVPLISGLGPWSPTVEGLAHGALRALSLILVVAAVHWILSVSSRDELVRCIRWLAAPLRVAGVSPERLALRLVLTLEYVHAIPALADIPPGQARGAGWRGRLRSLADRAAALFAAALAKAREAEPLTLELTPMPMPPLRQWLGLAAYVSCVGLVLLWARLG